MSAQKTSDPTDRRSTDQLKGSVKEAIGKLIGDGKVEAEGRVEAEGGGRREAPKSAAKPGAVPGS